MNFNIKVCRGYKFSRMYTVTYYSPNLILRQRTEGEHFKEFDNKLLELRAELQSRSKNSKWYMNLLNNIFEF